MQCWIGINYMSDVVIEHVMPPSDMARLRKVLTELDRVIIPPLSDRVDLNEYAVKLAALADIFYLKKDNQDIGNCAVYLNSTERGFISSIAVKKEYQGKGLGRNLLEKVRDIADSRGISEIRLEVFKNNSHAIVFYERMGFHVVDRKNDWIVMQIDYKVKR